MKQELKMRGDHAAVPVRTIVVVSLALCTSIATLAPLSRAYAQLNAGDVLVVDSAAATSPRGVLFHVGPSTGSRTVVSDFGNPAQGALRRAPRG